MNIMAVCAHPDDETLGCGGTLARHAAAGDQVTLLTLTDGVGARGLDPERQAQALHRACDILGIAHLVQGQFPNEGMDTVPLLAINKFIETALLDARPDILYTHTWKDLNQDHRRVVESVLVASRPERAPGSTVKRLLCFPPTTGPHPTLPFIPTYFVDISDYWMVKETALLKAYPHELHPLPHHRNLDALRAAAGAVATQAGRPGLFESYEVIRWLE